MATKTAKKLFSAVLCASLLAPSFATPDVGLNSVTAEINGSGYKVWSATGAEKIMREDVTYANKGGAKLDYYGVRNEYENAQLIITTDQTTEIDNYYLEKTDLKGPDDAIISAENVEVYNESYVECLTSAASPAFYYFGWVPDALVPIDLAKEANELKVGKNSNQGIWITVYIPKDIPAGEYTATFELTVGRDTYDIPVSVDVQDYTLTDEAHTGTYFAVWDDSLMGSELDSTVEMKTKYFEYLLDYRVVGSLPIESLAADEVLRVVDKYYDHPVVKDYVIPTFNWGVAGNGLPLEHLRKNIKAIASGSSPERNLLSKGWLYYMDEIDGTIGYQNGWNYIVNVNNMLQDVVNEIEADTTGTYDDFKRIENWKDVILGLDELVTVNPNTSPDWVFEEIGIICPGWGNMISQDSVAEKITKYDNEWWWYGCTGPSAPNPTYHVNDPNLLSSRFINWLAYDYHVTGLLYWATVSAGDSYKEPWYFWGNELTDWNLEDIPFNLGDGYLVYAGAKYGHDGPIPSIRLMSIRDGLEEYELIYALDELYEERGVGEQAYDVITSMYNSMYRGLIIKNDVELFMECRKTLIESVLMFSKPHGFVLSEILVINNIATIKMSLNDGYTMTVNGDSVTKGNDGNYTYRLNLDDSTDIIVQITSSDGTESYTIRRFISNKSIVINSFDTANEQSKVTTSKNSTLTAVTEENLAGTMKATVTSVFTGNVFTDLYFEPKVNIALDKIGDYKFSDLESLSFMMWNFGEEAIEFDVYITSGALRCYVSTVTLKPSQKVTTVSLDLYNITWERLDRVDGISFVFKNSGSADAPKTYEFYMDNMNGYVKE